MRQVTRRRTGSRAAASAAGTEELSSRRRGRTRDEDEDEEQDEGRSSRGRRRSSGGRDSSRPAPSSGGRGWASHRKNQARTKRSFDHPDEFKVAEEDTTYLIKPLEDEPFWSYCEHFIDEIAEGKRSFTCGGDDCALCDMGDTPRAYDLFNIAVWEPDFNNGEGGWVQKFWRATPDPAGKIFARAEELAGGKNARGLGDEDVYLAVSKSKSKKKKGGRSFNEFQVDLVKERDLNEDYDADPLSEDDWDEFEDKLFDETVADAASPKDLRAAAQALDD